MRLGFTNRCDTHENQFAPPFEEEHTPLLYVDALTSLTKFTRVELHRKARCEFAVPPNALS